MESYIKLGNDQVSKTADGSEVVWCDVRNAPFELHGFCDSDDDLHFRRVPSSIAEVTSPSVATLSKETAGGRVRFSTNSPYIAIRVKFRTVVRTHNLALISAAGFDLYVDGEYGSRYVKTFCMPANMLDSYEQIIKLDGDFLRSYTVNFPVHSVVESVELGFKPNSCLGGSLKPYKDIEPIVFYGSSIVHGIAASRPGNIYPALISRNLGVDFKNLGFSGAAKGEKEIAEWIASLPMSVFVFDYDHNAPTLEHLEATHHSFYEIIRKKNPELPFIMVTRPDYGSNIHAQRATLARRDIIMSSYLKARESGDKNVYFVDGLAFNLVPSSHDLSVDSCHPNDAGFMRMSDSIGAVIKHILEIRSEINV